MVQTYKDRFDIIENTREAQDSYGHGYGSEHITITPEHIDALMNGKQLAHYDGEYTCFVSMKKPT